jgi:hypothetical protein
MRNLAMGLVAAVSMFATPLMLGVERQEAGAPVLLPLDEAVNEPALLATRTAVITALRSRNVRPVLDLLADDFHIDGKRATRDNAAALFSGGVAGRSVETVLVQALSLGGTFTEDRGSIAGERQFCAPYPYSAMPREYAYANQEGDPSALITKDTPVHALPDSASPIVARLSYRIVFACPEGKALGPRGERWCSIWTADGVNGFVLPETVWNPDELHICFGLRGGAWRITSVAEGRLFR